MSMDTRTRPKLIKIILIVAVVLLLLHRGIKHFYPSTPPAQVAPSVVIQKPQTAKIVDYVTQTGSMVACNSVTLVARVEGYLDKVEFTDGGLVKNGQELFIIEPEPYLEKLKSAQASVAARKARYAYAIAEYARQKRMYTQNATSLSNVQKWLAQTEETKAEIDKSKADAEIAAINYSYTHIHSPFAGRIGRHLVDPGNLVGNGKATDLATVEQIDPIYVYFNLSELDLIKIRNAARAKGFKNKDINKIPVYVKMQNETQFLHEGKLDFVNTGLNASTGTMQFRGILSNKDYDLLPGLFVQVRIPINAATPHLTIPDIAVQYDQIGPYVYLVNNKQIVQIQRVELGPVEQGIRAVTKGLQLEDQVIIDGIQNATPGNAVSPVQREKNPA